MSNAKITDEQLIECLKLGMSNNEISKKYDIGVRSICRRKVSLTKRGWSPDHDMTHTVPDGYQVSGVSTLYGDDGKVKAQWVKSRDLGTKDISIVKEAAEKFCENLPKFKKTVKSKCKYNNDLLAVYPLGDPHIGMMSWGEESGEDWDLKIAENAFCSVFDRAIKSAPRCANALIVNLGDFFHYDNLAGVTERSRNILDRDSRYAKMVQVGVKILRQMITSALEHHETVSVINAIGNHDETGSLFLSICLSHVYENDPRVNIDTSPSLFHYKTFGTTMIGVHHGHTCKSEKLPAVMAADKSKEWGQSKYRYWLTGHIHHDSRKEYPGCMVESFRTIAARDAFATSGGWISGRDTKVIVYHKEFGEVERHTISIDQIKDLIK